MGQENKDLLQEGKRGLISASPFLWTVAIVSYFAFPVISGIWDEGQIECFRMWSEATKQGLSVFAYLGLGMFAWRSIRPDVVTADGAFGGYLASAFLGMAMFGNVINKCW